jgi:hypothetical protein
MLGTLDLNVMGLTFNIVGIVFLANSIKFKRMRRVVHEYFGVEKMYPLKEIREHVVRKIQVYMGFLFLMLGYVIQISAIIYSNVSADTTSMIKPNLLAVAGILVVSIAFITLLLKIVEVNWTRVSFKRLLIDFFRDHQWELVRNQDIAKEMGDLLKIPRHKDDSIEDHVFKIKQALHIEDEPEPENASNNVRRERAEMGIKQPGKLASQPLHRATPPRIE